MHINIVLTRNRFIENSVVTWGKWIYLKEQQLNQKRK